MEKKEVEEIAVCDCGSPYIWTFAFAYKEWVCLNCGSTHGMLGVDRVEATPELKYRRRLYEKIWKVLYGSNWFLPRSTYRMKKCKKCDEGEDHPSHLSKAEILKDKIATEIFERLTHPPL